MCQCGVCNTCMATELYTGGKHIKIMKQITLDDNTYDVDFDNNESIRTALRTEIIAQHVKYGITQPPGTEGQADEPRIHISSRATGVLQIQYSPRWRIYTGNHWKSIICFSESKEKSMKDIITKVIERCIKTNDADDKSQQDQADFRRFINSQFPDIECNVEVNQYNNNVVIARFEREGVKATLHKDNWLTVAVEKDKDIIIDVINKLFR